MNTRTADFNVHYHDEERTIKGTTYRTIQGSARRLVRTARYEYACDSHNGDTIHSGEVYVEVLTNGSHESGDRFCQQHAIERGMLEA